MAKSSIREAKAEAASLLKRHCVRALPVDPESIAESEGFRVVYVDFSEHASSLISGLYDHKSQKIYVNKQLPANQKTFTIAHELAHAILHQDYAASTEYRAMPRSNSHVNKPQTEKEADVFAACLLVPPETLKKYREVASIAELAALYAVSESVVRNQMDFV